MGGSGDDSLSGHIEFSAFKINSIRVIQIRMEFFLPLVPFLFNNLPSFLILILFRLQRCGFSATDCVESAAAALRFDGIYCPTLNGCSHKCPPSIVLPFALALIHAHRFALLLCPIANCSVFVECAHINFRNSIINSKVQ